MSIKRNSSPHLRPDRRLGQDYEALVKGQHVADLVCRMDLEGSVFLKIRAVIRGDVATFCAGPQEFFVRVEAQR